MQSQPQAVMSSQPAVKAAAAARPMRFIKMEAPAVMHK
jgi:hypothetical protein